MARLVPTVTALREGRLDLAAHVERTLTRVEAIDPIVQALVPEEDRSGRLRCEATALAERRPVPAAHRDAQLLAWADGIEAAFRVEAAT